MRPHAASHQGATKNLSTKSTMPKLTQGTQTQRTQKTSQKEKQNRSRMIAAKNEPSNFRALRNTSSGSKPSNTFTSSIMEIERSYSAKWNLNAEDKAALGGLGTGVFFLMGVKGKAFQFRDPAKPFPKNQQIKFLENNLSAQIGKEHIDLLSGSGGMHAYENFAKARTTAKISANLGEDAVPFLQMRGPYKNKIYTGMQSKDGARGWRLDFDPQDPNKAGHINWWYYPDPNNLKLKYKGLITIENCLESDYLKILSHFPKR